jgi:hypothetical protein
MTTIRKFVHAALLAATTLTFTPFSMFAQDSARGHFTLTHDVIWGGAKIPAGQYAFTYDQQDTAPVMILSKLNGTRMGFMVLVPSTDSARGSVGNRLVLASSPEGSYVTAMELPEFGMTLHFLTPRRITEKELAKSTVAGSGQISEQR